jgi:hypothetical protein
VKLLHKNAETGKNMAKNAGISVKIMRLSFFVQVYAGNAAKNRK